jgi:RHS repeat-associated protein
MEVFELKKSKVAQEEVLRSKDCVYDASSKVVAHTVDGVTTSYAYDGAGQLVSESRPGYLATYTYDANGNRLTRTVNGVTETYLYDAGDKLLSVSVGGVVVRSFGCDTAGRTTSVVTSAGTTTLTYDYRGRATSIVGPGVAQTNLFNGLDTRVGSTTNSVPRTFLRDGAYVTDPVLTDGAAFYTPGVSERRGGVTTFLHSGLKNAEAQTSAAQTLSATRTYDAFGNVISGSGAWQGPFGYGGPFGYQEDATGLKLLGHRLYDPSTGRFLTRDPIKDGRNWYVYCANGPVGATDPDGLYWRVVVRIVVGILPSMLDSMAGRPHEIEPAGYARSIAVVERRVEVALDWDPNRTLPCNPPTVGGPPGGPGVPRGTPRVAPPSGRSPGSGGGIGGIGVGAGGAGALAMGAAVVIPKRLQWEQAIRDSFHPDESHYCQHSWDRYWQATSESM